MNVLQKLAKARLEFLQGGTNKSGKNTHLEFKYFELQDIVPKVTEIFEKIGLLQVTNIDTKELIATMTVYNTEDMNDNINFTIPFVVQEPIYNNKDGKKVSNDCQQMGASITYSRRYLYMVAMDIVESDIIEPNLKSEEETSEEPTESLLPKKKAIKKQKPKTEEEKAEIVEKLTDEEEKADGLQIKALKSLCKELKELDGTKDEMIQQIVVKTEKFTNLSKVKCQQLIDTVGSLIEEVKTK